MMKNKNCFGGYLALNYAASDLGTNASWHSLNVIFWLYFGIFTRRYRSNYHGSDIMCVYSLRPSSVTINAHLLDCQSHAVPSVTTEV